ncbi:TetR family transcriptional regulator [Dictyobacter alpinus]|uniref:TetR family transcriptional regulator n=1 Tax=Dictyobacter alpinus TaxID=2014873 RepID=A0A402BAP4_9CHLR|nr:TetR/AcrR family transcriptional regulator [Dictyobacter alpinus]GCE28370.1 TetR family transcriptional regulator [Dictyobacter alpinus]
MAATTRRFASQTAENDERRLKLVQSAYQLIAEKGMAGLRIREVAARIHLNHATLLYYFPTKEALIRGVIDYCIQQFEVVHQQPDASSQPTSNELFQQRYFADLAYQLRTAPELFLVLDELLLHARRDPLTNHIFTEAMDMWLQFLIQNFEDEVSQGRLRADLDVRSAAFMVITFCQGISLLLNARPDDIDNIIHQLEHWLLNSILPSR